MATVNCLRKRRTNLLARSPIDLLRNFLATGDACTFDVVRICETKEPMLRDMIRAQGLPVTIKAGVWSWDKVAPRVRLPALIPNPVTNGIGGSWMLK